jgi:hypothetical protein
MIVFFRKRCILFINVILLIAVTDQIQSQYNDISISFTHPSTIFTREQLIIIKDRIANNIEPQKSAFEKLISDADRFLDYMSDPPARMDITNEQPEQHEQRRYMVQESWVAYASALAYTLTGNTAYADKAIEVLNAWSRPKTYFSTYDAWRGTYFTGRPRRLQVASRLTPFVYAYDLLYDYEGWDIDKREEFKNWWYDKIYGWEYAVQRTTIATLVTSTSNRGNNQCAGIFSVIATGFAFHDPDLIQLGMERIASWFESTENYPLPTSNSHWKFRKFPDHADPNYPDRGWARHGVYYWQDIEYGGEYRNGPPLAAYAYSMSMLAVEMLRQNGVVNFWDEDTWKTPEGATLRQAIEDHFFWWTRNENYYWTDGKPGVPRSSWQAQLEIINNLFDIPEIERWLNQQGNRPMKMDTHGIPAEGNDTYITLNRGDMAVSEIISHQPGIPDLRSPENESIEKLNQVTVQWVSSASAENYDLEIAESSNFSTTTIEINGIRDNSYTVTDLEKNKSYYWRVQATNSSGTSGWSDIWSFTIHSEKLSQHLLYLDEGWNIVSSYINPVEADLGVLFKDVLSNLSIVMNNNGDVYWPEFDVDEIGTWDIREGFQVYMNESDTLVLSGEFITPEDTPISLTTGWNLIAYLWDQPIPVETALENISSSLVIVANNAGELYWPEFEINDIGLMQPGEGYRIFVNNPVTLIYPSRASPNFKLSTYDGESMQSEGTIPIHY